MTSGDGVSYLRETMTILRGDDGCLWDREQTHDTLIPFLIEESAELVDAIEAGNRENLVEELGDVLYQVLFHADILSDHPTDPLTLDDVARRTAEKMRRRHPHVFGDVEVSSVEEIRDNWQKTKKAEKGHSRPIVDQVPHSLHPLARAQALMARADRHGVDTGVVPATVGGEDEVGNALLALVEGARRSGIDADAALRAAVRRLERTISGNENSGS